MALQDKTEEEIRALEQQLLAQVLAFGGKAGNTRLIRTLQLPEEDYWGVRNRLVDAGALRLYRARGGAVELPPLPQAAAEEVVAPAGNLAPALIPADPAREAERDLYEPVAAVLRGQWSLDFRFQHQLVEIIASQGRRNTGGTWTRPDIVIAAIRVFPYLPGKFFDLITFEIKPRWALDVTAVYEALAHRRAATQSYVWLHCPDPAEHEEILETIREEAERHGIGLIVAADPANYDTWDTRCEPTRVEPDPELLNQFVALQLPTGAKDALGAWVR